LATNKHATIRYRTLDKCFRNSGRKYFIDDLIEACSEAIYEYIGVPTTVSRRQIFDDITFMESEAGFAIELVRHKDGKKVYYRYEDVNFSINNQPLNANEELQLKEALLTLSRFKGVTQFEWVEEVITRLDSQLNLSHKKKLFIEFEQNKYLKGLHYISVFYDAISNQKCLNITYKSFKSEEPIILIFHAYFLKQYNNRWFVFGRNDEYGTIQNLSLDRIETINESDTKYIDNEEVDFSEYFEDVIGVTIPTDNNLEKIEIEVDNSLLPYLETKPLHESQKPPKRGDVSSIITFSVIPNYELEALLLSFGKKIKVIAPETLKAKLKARIETMKSNYIF
jgi:predicted DNA-binding transcriptional regulator YafY